MTVATKTRRHKDTKKWVMGLKTSDIPLLEKEGWTRHQTRYREATFEGADGVVRPAKSSGLKVSRSDHIYGFALSRSRFAPVCAEQGGFALFV